MYKSQWTNLVVISLVAITLAGCAVPGRFSREQYAQLDSDPFISEEPERSTVLSQVADRAASLTSRKSAEPTDDRFAFVEHEECLESPECVPEDSMRLAEVPNQPEEALASFFEVPEEAEVPRQLKQTVAQADDEFSSFMTREKGNVVHASAEFIDTVESAQQDVQQTVEQSGSWGFQNDGAVEPATMKQVDVGVAGSNPFFEDSVSSAQSNPFGDDESTPSVAPPSDVFGEPSESANWPPGDFEFN